MPPEDDDIAHTPTIERIARVLAAYAVSANAGGDDPSAGDDVDRDWLDHVDTAVAVLKAIREPDADMAAIGDVACWRRMIESAILGRARIDLPITTTAEQPAVRDAGTDVHVHDGAWTRRDERLDETFPASDPAPINPGVA